MCPCARVEGSKGSSPETEQDFSQTLMPSPGSQIWKADMNVVKNGTDVGDQHNMRYSTVAGMSWKDSTKMCAQYSGATLCNFEDICGLGGKALKALCPQQKVQMLSLLPTALSLFSSLLVPLRPPFHIYTFHALQLPVCFPGSR